MPAQIMLSHRKNVNAQQTTDATLDILRTEEHAFLSKTNTELPATDRTGQENGERKTVLFNRTSKGIKKWKAKAMLSDPHKTKIIIELTEGKQRHVPPWVYKELVEPQKDNSDER
jgi:hypothetical protein